METHGLKKDKAKPNDKRLYTIPKLLVRDYRGIMKSPRAWSCGVYRWTTEKHTAWHMTRSTPTDKGSKSHTAKTHSASSPRSKAVLLIEPPAGDMVTTLEEFQVGQAFCNMG